MMKAKNKYFLCVCKKSSQGPCRDLSWVTNRPQQNPTKTYNFFNKVFLVIERYGYQSIRTDLINIFRLVLSRFEEKNNHEILVNIVTDSSKYYKRVPKDRGKFLFIFAL